MKHPSELVETINKILDNVDMLPGKGKGKSLINFDALHAIRHVLSRPSEWNSLSDNTVFKRTLKKKGVVI
ncbi:MAG: hypothetical protein EBT92_14480 [Planctomycetes bacterium]|nr:hypothetical protein [Planctomycetota bacterium]